MRRKPPGELAPTSQKGRTLTPEPLSHLFIPLLLAQEAAKPTLPDRPLRSGTASAVTGVLHGVEMHFPLSGCLWPPSGHFSSLIHHLAQLSMLILEILPLIWALFPCGIQSFSGTVELEESEESNFLLLLEWA